MNARTSFALLLALVLAGSSVVVVANNQPAKDGDNADQADRADRAARPRARARLTKPWSELTSLSADQKEQIIQIHADAVEAMRKIREKEEADIMALLTEENMTEYRTYQEKQRADAKARRAKAADDKTDGADGDGDKDDDGGRKDK